MPVSDYLLRLFFLSRTLSRMALMCNFFASFLSKLCNLLAQAGLRCSSVLFCFKESTEEVSSSSPWFVGSSIAEVAIAASASLEIAFLIHPRDEFERDMREGGDGRNSLSKPFST